MSYGGSTQLKALAARSLSGANTTQSPGVQVQGAVDWVAIQVNVTAMAGTSPNLTLSLQWSQDDGATWADADASAADSFTAITAAGKVVKRFQKKGDLFRLKEVFTGTTPTATYDLFVNYR